MTVYLNQIFYQQYQVQQHLREMTGRTPGPIMQPPLRLPDTMKLNDMQRIDFYNPNTLSTNLGRRDQFFKP